MLMKLCNHYHTADFWLFLFIANEAISFFHFYLHCFILFNNSDNHSLCDVTKVVICSWISKVFAVNWNSVVCVRNLDWSESVNLKLLNWQFGFDGSKIFTSVFVCLCVLVLHTHVVSYRSRLLHTLHLLLALSEESWCDERHRESSLKRLNVAFRATRRKWAEWKPDVTQRHKLGFYKHRLSVH